jgi:hypothetical protein
MTKTRHIRARRKYWTPRQLQVLHRRYPNEDTAVVAKALGRTVLSVYQGAQKAGIRKSAIYMHKQRALEKRRLLEHGAAHRFGKGHVPANKGMRHPAGWGPGRMKETQFKKGQRSGEAAKNWMPIGSYRVDNDGYLRRKVSDVGYGPKDWEAVHRLVWIEANGAIPPGHAIAFKGGQRTTVLEEITLDRIEIVSRRELMRRNSYHTNLPSELRKIVQLRGAVQRQINRRRAALEKQS